MKDLGRLTEKDEVQSLTVAVRVRPINDAEIEHGCTDIAHVIDVENMVVLMDPCDDPDDILRVNRSRERQYVFDLALGPAASQKDVYEQTTKDLIDSVIDGYNATVFAYGPTGAGKTHTMLGTDSEPGIMVRTLDDLFKEMDDTSTDSNYAVTMSYLEIYNEMIRDLLNPSSGYLDLREDSKGVVVAGLSEITAVTTKDVMQMLSMGNKQRTCEPTAVNKTSSRSHAVLQVTVKQRSRLRNIVEEVKIGKLFMIDLAGSERAANTQNRGKRLIEGAHINRSLLALGNCINALCERGIRGSQYVNYRDSKLTRLLKDSLGGNCRTVMIAHISPASMCYEESKNTLSYADRAKNIKLKVKRNQYSVNYHIAQYQSIIAELRQEILRLKTKMADNDLKSQQNSASSANFRGCRESKLLEKLRTELVESFREQMEIRRQLIDLEDTAMRCSVDYQRHLLTIDEWEQEKAKRLAGLDIEQHSTTSDSTKKPQTIRKKLLYRRPKYDPLDISNKDLDTEKNILRSFDEGWEPADVIAAREEIQQIALKEKDVFDKKKELQESLDVLRKERQETEDGLVKKVPCEGHRELLKLLCNVHELELKNAELQSIAMLKDHLMQQNDLNFQKQEMKQKLCDEIIQMQRSMLEEKAIETPSELEVLYQIYLQQMNESELNTPCDSTTTLGAVGGTHDLKMNFLSGNSSSLPVLSTVPEEKKNMDGNSKKTRRRWIDSLSDMEGEESTRKDFPATKVTTSIDKFGIPTLLRQDTATTFTIDDGHSTGDDMKVAKNKKPFRKNKMKSTEGVVSDNEAITHKRFSKKDVSLKKASKSDSKLFRNLNARIREKQFGMSNSMNDLSNIKTSKKTDDSVEDLKGNDTEDFDNYDRPRERQRSSSLDMGREKLRLRLAAHARKVAKKPLVKKNSDYGIPFSRLPQKKISVDEMSVVTVDSKVSRPAGNRERDDISNFSANHTPNVVHQIGTPAGKGQTIRKQQKNGGQEKLLGFGATIPQSKSRPKKTKQTLGGGDGLSVSGFSMVPKQLKPGHKRF